MVRRILIFLCLFAGFLNAGIVNTKHNISISGPGTIKATSEQEICAFCHIPHGAQAGKPLWNREMPTSSYTMYSSTFLERTNYPTPTDLGTTVDTPGNLSRQCLSCHDGTIAIGGIYSIRGTVLGENISVANTNADGTMKNSATGFIGTDLSAHHPVGFEYGATMTFDIDEASRGNELLPSNSVTGVKLYTYSGKKYVECSSCHDPHTENKKFLRIGSDNNDSHAKNIKNTCTSCHAKENWGPSAHATNTTPYTDATVLSDYGAGTTVADMGCVNCHTPHNGEGQPYLLRKIEQNTCFQGAAGSTATASCHQSSGAKDIETPLNRFFGHGFRMLFTDGVHTNLDYVYGENVTRNPLGSKGIEWSDSKHVECMDCHNQHQAKAGTRALSTSWYPLNNQGTNLISDSGPLTGASGVRPTTWPAQWNKPTGYTTLETATYEYEVCFKCHTSWALDNTTTPISTHATISDASVNFTDTAWEFNKNNRSGHPVTVSANNRTGSPTTKALADSQMKNPWKNEGLQTMYCSDCHGTDNESTTDAKGPHGSSYKFMLKGNENYWPTNSGGSHYQAGESYSDGNRSGLFCQNCHNINVDRSGGKGAPHMTKEEMDGLYCVRCHVAIPHGSPLSRLQAYDSFPEPYNYQGNMAKLNGFKKAGTYAREDASGGSWSPPEATGNGNCNDKHNNTTSGAESSPY